MSQIHFCKNNSYAYSVIYEKDEHEYRWIILSLYDNEEVVNRISFCPFCGEELLIKK